MGGAGWCGPLAQPGSYAAADGRAEQQHTRARNQQEQHLRGSASSGSTDLGMSQSMTVQCTHIFSIIIISTNTSIHYNIVVP